MLNDDYNILILNEYSTGIDRLITIFAKQYNQFKTIFYNW